MDSGRNKGMHGRVLRKIAKAGSYPVENRFRNISIALCADWFYRLT